jgi:hypothetical protein
MNSSSIPAKKSLPFRQIHLDFHTSPHITGIGSKWDKAAWQKTLQEACVDSVTLFAKCHHGWSYHPTKVGKMHPHLDFDLLKAQVEACREIGVQTPIYLSAGVDNLASDEHPEWREISIKGQYTGWAQEPIAAGFHKMCFHSPYVDYLCEQIREVAEMYPDCEGIFLDIIASNGSCTKWALERMDSEGLNPENPEDLKRADELALERYYDMTTQAVLDVNPKMPVFHNSGHIAKNNRRILQYFSHLELESLPTGGWGYDHFPISIKFTGKLGFDVLGMTGKFHTTWGEFGGLKHPNALRYECAAMLAFGSKCSVGDQLSPEGALDASTYRIIGSAYREVRKKEPWCTGVSNIAEIAILSSESESAEESSHMQDNAGDVGAGRVLLEEHYLFDLIHREADFDGYRVVILPDDIRVDRELKEKLEGYLDQGGKVFLTGTSGFDSSGETMMLDGGFESEGLSPFQPDYLLPVPDLRPEYIQSPLVAYLPSRRIVAKNPAESLGQIYDPWFNRNWKHFCSHQHAPARPEPSGYDLGVHHGNMLYLAHPLFSLYRAYGAVVYRNIIAACLDRLLGERMLESNLPSTARVNLMRQEEQKRSILHLLHANTIQRGGPVQLSGGNVDNRKEGIEVIEDLIPLHDVQIRLKPPCAVGKITLEPEGESLKFEVQDGKVVFQIDRLECHQMIVFHDHLSQ